MIIAVPFKEGQVDPHFGHTSYFMLYEIEDFSIKEETMIENSARGHDAVVELLYKNHVSVVICHGLGDGARLALEEKQIRMVRGASGDARQAVEAYLEGRLTDKAVGCAHKKVQFGKQ